MPEWLHRKLATEAKHKFGTTKSRRAKAYIFGTLNRLKKKLGVK